MGKSKKNKILGCLLLHALGDTIGFKNGEWEFNHFTNKTININDSCEILFEFIKLGGINNINLKKWLVSDDTLFNIATIKAILIFCKKNDDIYKLNTEDFIIILKEEFINLVKSNKLKNSFPGMTTMNSITLFMKDINNDARLSHYDINAGGNGCAMRTSIFGLLLYGKKNRDLLIDTVIKISQITHNSPIGYLGGVNVALMVSFGMEKIPIEKWPYKLVKILKAYKSKIKFRSSVESKDYDNFIKYWNRYIDFKFDLEMKLINLKSNHNLFYRTKFFYEKFMSSEYNSLTIGDSGFSAPIMAYDALIDCKGSWESLVIYSMLHIGDSDTTGAIAGCFYGVVYGLKTIPKNNLKYLEYKKDLLTYHTKLYELL